jgi:hypothetical protein
MIFSWSLASVPGRTGTSSGGGLECRRLASRELAFCFRNDFREGLRKSSNDGRLEVANAVTGRCVAGEAGRKGGKDESVA